jgi:hypothetical protein
MKRTFLILASLLFVSFFAYTVHAADNSAAQAVGQQLGVSTDQLNNIPTSPQELKDNLLKQSWADLIEKNKYLGPVNSFLNSISPVFVVLFGESYSLSPALLLVIILWFYVTMELTIFLNGLGMLNSWANRGIAAGISILLAQAGLYRGIGLFLENLVYSPDIWYVRIIIALGLGVGLFILHYIMKLIEKQLKLSKKNAQQETLKQEVEKEKIFIENLKEGSKLGGN